MDAAAAAVAAAAGAPLAALADFGDSAAGPEVLRLRIARAGSQSCPYPCAVSIKKSGFPVAASACARRGGRAVNAACRAVGGVAGSEFFSYCQGGGWGG